MGGKKFTKRPDCRYDDEEEGRGNKKKKKYDYRIYIAIINYYHNARRIGGSQKLYHSSRVVIFEKFTTTYSDSSFACFPRNAFVNFGPIIVVFHSLSICYGPTSHVRPGPIFATAAAVHPTNNLDVFTHKHGYLSSVNRRTIGFIYGFSFSVRTPRALSTTIIVSQ